LKTRRTAQLKARRSRRRCRMWRPQGDELGVIRIDGGKEGVRDGGELGDEGGTDAGEK
jgi:hypothetical protein